MDFIPSGTSLKKSGSGILRGWTAKLYERRQIAEAKRRELRVAEEARIAEDVHAVCQNCGANLTGRFCHSCGQKDGELKRPIWSFFREFVENIFAADSRFAKSMVVLMLFPGGLTRSYMSGMRARYMTPVKIYLVASIAFFLTLSIASVSLLDVRLFNKDMQEQAALDAQVEASKVDEGERSLPKGSDDLNDIIDGMAKETAALEQDCGVYNCFAFGKSNSGYLIGVAMFAPVTSDQRISITMEEFQRYFDVSDEELLESPMLKAVMRGIVRGFENPTLFNDLFNKWIPRILFVLMPLFALILRVFHWGKGRYYVHHLVFSLHFHSFLFLLLIAEIFIAPILGGARALDIFWWGASLYLVIALKVAMDQGIIRAFLKAGFVWVTYWLFLIIAIGYAVVAGLAEY